MVREACERLLAVKDLVASGDGWRGRGVIASSNVSYAVERCSLVPPLIHGISADVILTVSSEPGLLLSPFVGVVGLSAMICSNWVFYGGVSGVGRWTRSVRGEVVGFM